MAAILVVDDQLEVRELVRHALQGNGHRVTSVPSVDQAIAALAREPVDLVVLDLGFPDGSGAALLQQIRQAHNAVPIVVYSGMVTSELEKQLRAAGANEVMSKEVGVLQLVKQAGKIVQASNTSVGSLGSATPTTLLIVDDEASIRQLLREFFKKKRFRILEAESGEQAIELVKMEHLSVVLLDVVMPGLDGLTTLKKLLEIDPKLGVVMATGQQDDQTVKQAVELGAYGYVLKPFDLLYLELVVLSRLMIAATAAT